MNGNGKACIFSLTGFFALDNGACIVKNLTYLLGFVSIRRNNEFKQVVSSNFGTLRPRTIVPFLFKHHISKYLERSF